MKYVHNFTQTLNPRCIYGHECQLVDVSGIGLLHLFVPTCTRIFLKKIHTSCIEEKFLQKTFPLLPG